MRLSESALARVSRGSAMDVLAYDLGAVNDDLADVFADDHGGAGAGASESEGE